MNKLIPVALAATVATFALVPAAFAAETQPVHAAVEAAGQVPVTAGRMIYGPDGNRIAAAYRVTTDGTVQVILDGRLVNIPASTLSEANGKVQTTLTKRDLRRAR